MPEIVVTGLGLSSGFQSSVPHFSRGSDYTTAIPGLRFACRSPGYVDSTFRGMSITSGAGSIPKTCGSRFLHHWARYRHRTPRSLTSHEVLQLPRQPMFCFPLRIRQDRSSFHSVSSAALWISFSSGAFYISAISIRQFCQAFSVFVRSVDRKRCSSQDLRRATTRDRAQISFRRVFLVHIADRHDCTSGFDEGIFSSFHSAYRPRSYGFLALSTHCTTSVNLRKKCESPSSLLTDAKFLMLI
jgi:hypothetical protein